MMTRLFCILVFACAAVGGAGSLFAHPPTWMQDGQTTRQDATPSLEERLSALDRLGDAPAGDPAFGVLLDELEPLLDSMTTRQRQRWRYRKAQFLFNVGQLDDARTLIDINLQQSSDLEVFAKSAALEVGILVALGDYIEAFRQIPSALEAARETRDPFLILTMLYGRLLAYRDSQIFQPALDAANDMIAYASDQENLFFVCVAQTLKSEILLNEGRNQDALTVASEARTLCPSHAGPVWSISADHLYSTALLEQNNPAHLDTVLTILGEAAQSPVLDSVAFIKQGVLASLSEAKRRANMLDEAEALAEEALSALPSSLGVARRMALKSAYMVARDQGRDRKALDLFEQYFDVQRAFVDIQLARQSAYQQVAAENIRKDREIERLSFENIELSQQQRISELRFLVGGLAGGSLILFAAILVLYLRRIRREKDEFRRKAEIDGLTGVANRRRFIDALGFGLTHARAARQPLGVIMFDIDHFKSVNDRFGHHVGDKVLKRLATLCTENLREADLIGRIGGEEFAIMLPNTTPETSLRVAERCRQALADDESFKADGLDQVTSSFGVAVIAPDADPISPEEALRRADLALYRSKEAGRNRVTLQGES